MANLETTYMGLPLRSPIVIASSSLSNVMDRVQRAEQAGVGAVVVRSLFEEQIRNREPLSAEEEAELREEINGARAHFPQRGKSEVKAYLLWLEKLRTSVQIPIIASLNATSPGSWVEFAREIASTGVDALELNIYNVESSLQRSSHTIELEHIEIVQRVTDAVSVPVAVKLSPFYVGMAHMANKIATQNASALVLFNRFLQPDIRLNNLSVHNHMELSSRYEMQLPLRWIALLHGHVDAHLALSTGVQDGEDVIKGLLAGAQVVQVAGVLLRKGVQHIEHMNDEISAWMDRKDFSTVQDFRGKLSHKHSGQERALERAQYVDLLLGQH